MIEKDRWLNLKEYDEKIFSLNSGSLGDISKEWAVISVDSSGPTKKFALIQALLYQLQSEIVLGQRKVFAD
jgi:hypothetical protein